MNNGHEQEQKRCSALLTLDKRNGTGRLRGMFDQAKAEQVIERMYEGKSLRSAAAEVGVKHPTFLLWAEQNPPIADQYARAMAQRAEIHAERIEGMVDKIESGEIAPDQGRVMLDALKWTASKLNPKRYGDRIQHEVDATVTLVVEDPRVQAVARLVTNPAPLLTKPDAE